MLPMFTKLKFLDLVLPTVTSWLVIWVHLVLLERKRWLGQVHNSKKELKVSSFSAVESWLCPTVSEHCLEKTSQTPSCLYPHGIYPQTPPAGAGCPCAAHERTPLSHWREILKIKSPKLIRWSQNFPMKGWKGRSGTLTQLRYRSLVPAVSPCSSSNMQFLITSCKELFWLRVWAKTALNMPPLCFRVFCQPNCSWEVTLSLGIRPFLTVPCKELRED